MDLHEAAKQEGGYQDIVINGSTVHGGWRSCPDRWEIVRKALPARSFVALDIGSHYGYFSQKMSEMGGLVWSMECDPARAEIQQEMLDLNNNRNVIITRRAFELEGAMRLLRTCARFDVILALSVLHYLDEDELEMFLWVLGRLSPVVIVEFPNPLEEEVAEKKRVLRTKIEYVLSRCFDHVGNVGSAPSPKSVDVPRHIFCCRNDVIHRQRCYSHIYAAQAKKHDVTCENGNWKIDDTDIQHEGINLFNLRYFEPHELQNRWFFEAAQKYYALIQETDGKVTDIHPRNVIITPAGVEVIDYSEGVGSEMYGKPWEQYRAELMKSTLKGLEKWLYKMWEKDLME